MFRLEYPEYLWLLAIIPLFIIIYIIYTYIKSKKLKIYGDPVLINKLIPDKSKYKPHTKFGIMMLAIGVLVFALANPQVGTKMEEVQVQGIEIMVALDVSNSMNAEDILPSRLQRSKQIISRLIDNLHNDRIGLVVFAGQAFMQLPMTTDYAAAKMMLSTVNTDIVQTQGTAIGAAIDLASESFSSDETTNKALIIITDGENHEDDAIKSAKQATAKGIIIHTIGIGSIDGAPIPVYSGQNQIGYLKDRQGNTVITKLDPAILNQIAVAGNGLFVRTTTGDLDLTSVINQLSGMEKTDFDTRVFTEFDNKFQIFIALAILFLFLEFFLTNRKNKYWEKLSNFAGGKK